MEITYYRAGKGVALFRYLFFHLFLDKSSWFNFRYRFCSFNEYKNITIGRNNTFKSGVIIDGASLIKGKSIVIGNNNCFDRDSTLFAQGGAVIIGNNNFIGFRGQIQGAGGVSIGNNCMIAGNVFISSSNHDISEPESSNYLLNEMGAKVTIEDNVWLGANCVITAGVMIGRCSVVGAGSVVTKNVEPYTIVAGTPAKPIKKYDFQQQQWVRIEDIK